MSKKAIFILFIGLLFVFSAKAQKRDTMVYYMKISKLSESPVNNKDSADFFRVIISPDTSTDKDLYVVNDFYKNGKPKMMGKAINPQYNALLTGMCIEFFPNGHRKSIKDYNNGMHIGDQTDYYPNGRIYFIGNYDNVGYLKRVECRDSIGNVIAENGTGKWIVYSSDFKLVLGEGPITNGKEEGEWHGYVNDSITYKCVYKNGGIVSGKSYERSGKEHEFTQFETEPQFAGGLRELQKFISQHLHYPAAAKENNVQGKVFATFVIDEQGKMINIKIVRGIGSGCDEEVIRVLKLASSWTPGYRYGVPVRIACTIPVSFNLSIPAPPISLSTSPNSRY